MVTMSDNHHAEENLPTNPSHVVEDELQPAAGGEFQKRNPTVFNPLIQAIMGERFRFRTEDQAIARLKRISYQFDTLSGEEELPVTLWIRGFMVTPEEDKRGFLGNFAMLRTRQFEDGAFTIYATKVEIDIVEHPRKKRIRYTHPNWGHPNLRKVYAAEPYESVDAARWTLISLHEEFPDISIPASENRLFIIIYDKNLKAEGRQPIQKIVLDIEEQPDGTAIIRWRENFKPLKAGGGQKMDAVVAAIMAGRSNG
jgi:hypothetical protein